MARWKLLSGIHSDKTARLVSSCKLEGVERQPNTFYPGDVFDSDKDLTRHNTRDSRGQPVSVRFERVGDSPSSKGTAALVDREDELDTMTVKELRDFAEREEIDLGDAKQRVPMIEAIRAATMGV